MSASLVALINKVKEPLSDLSSIHQEFLMSLRPYKGVIKHEPGFLREALIRTFSNDFPVFIEAVDALENRINNQTLETQPHIREQLLEAYRYRDAQKEGLSIWKSLFPLLGGENKVSLQFVVDVVTMFLRCVADSPSQQTHDDYRYSLSMLEEIQPWLGFLECEEFRRQVVTHLTKCTLFLVGQREIFEELALRFCVKTFLEYVKLAIDDTIPKKGEEKSLLVFLDVVDNVAIDIRNERGNLCLSVASHFGNLAKQLSEVTSSPVHLITKLYAMALSVTTQMNNKTSGDYSSISEEEKKTYTPKVFHDMSNPLESLSIVLGSLNPFLGGSVCAESKNMESQRHIHSGACDEAYLPLYFNALTFLCEPMSYLIYNKCEDILGGSEDISSFIKLTKIDDAFIEYNNVFHAYRCSALEKKSGIYKPNIPAAANAVITLSLITNQRVEERINFVKDLISADWVPTKWLKYLSTSLHNVGSAVYKSNRLEEATILVNLSTEAAWKFVRHNCKMFTSSESKSLNYLEDEIATSVKEAIKSSTVLLQILDQCGVQTIQKTLIGFILSWFEAHRVQENIPRLVDLLKAWVEIERKGTKLKTPYSLMPYLKQLEAYKELENLSPKLSKIIQSVISNFLLEEIYTTNDDHLHHSWKLIANARKIRALGFKKLNDCTSFLSDAISTLRDHKKNINGDGSICLLLAEAYGMRAMCKQEAEPNKESYVEDINEALKLWCSDEYDQFVGETQLVSHTTFNLLYYFSDLLSLKVYKEDLHLKIYKLLIKFCTQTSDSDDFLTLLWKSRSLNHALCASPLSDTCMKAFSELHCERSMMQWKDCMARSESAALKIGFDHSLLVDYTFSSHRENQFFTTTNQVKEAVSDVIRIESHRSGKSAFLAAQLYYDLGERLFAKGSMMEALFYAKEAHRLRKKCSASYFNCEITHCKSDVHVNGVPILHEAEMKDFSMDASARLAWSCDFQDFNLTPYNVLRCQLESTLQEGTIEEILGNERSARYLFLWGKTVSSFHGLPMFTVTFSCALAKVYRKLQKWELAAGEVKVAKDTLNESRSLISCSKCRSILEVTVCQESGDHCRSRLSNTPSNKLMEDQREHLLKHAHEFYQSAEDFLREPEWKNSISNPEDVNEENQLLCEALLNARKSVNISSNCWHCAPLAVTESNSLKRIIQMKWECTRRRRLLRVLIALGKYFVVKGKMERAHDVFLRSISLLVSRNTFCSSSTLPSFTYLADLIRKNVIGDVFAIEIASFLYIISWFSLKNYVDKDERSLIPFPDVVSGLKLAFILSREVPELFQKVSRLLSVLYTLLCTRNQFGISSPLNGLSENQWASFFQQATIGTNLNYKLFSRSHKKRDENTMELDISRGCSSSNSMNLNRMAPDSVTHLEDFVLDFFQSLPRASTVICITIFKDDLLGSLLSKGQTKESAWIMFSRLSSDCAPLVVILPIDPINEDPRFGNMEGSDKICWGRTIVDEVAPHFRKFMIEEENKSCSTSKLERFLQDLLRNMEESWFGTWRHLLLGYSLYHDVLDSNLKEMIKNLKSTYNLDVHESTLRSLMSCAIEGTINEHCLYELILNKGCYVGDRQSGHHGSPLEDLRVIKKLLDPIIQNNKRKMDKEPATKIREPIILVLDYDIQMLPWESMSILRNQEVYRMPSVASIFNTFARCSHSTYFPAIDPLDVYYLVNLGGDLNCAEDNFGNWFKELKFDGISGRCLYDHEHRALLNHLVDHDLFIYVGHGNGLKYVPKDIFERSDGCAAAVLAGCKSAELHLCGPYIPRGAPLRIRYACILDRVCGIHRYIKKDSSNLESSLKCFGSERVDKNTPEA